eukprot:3542956-Ditylum_brightwellii.AAC.1
MQSADPLTQIVRDTPSPTQKHLMWYATAPLFSTPGMTDVAHHRMLRNKPMHGSWFCQQAEVPQVDPDQSNSWLTRADLWGEIEALMCGCTRTSVVNKLC